MHGELLIKNGSVYTQEKLSVQDVLIQKTKIKATGKGFTANKVISAQNHLVLPGAVDIHVHFRDFGEEHKEDWQSGSAAAASGGVTTVIDMPNNINPVLSYQDYIKKKSKIESIINFDLYTAVTENNVIHINQSPLKYVKLYYGPTTKSINSGNLESIFKKLSNEKFLLVHAEENELIIKNQLKYPTDNPANHTLIRDSDVEAVAVNKIIQLASKHNRQVHFTHVSSAASIKLIADKKKN